MRLAGVPGEVRRSAPQEQVVATEAFWKPRATSPHDTTGRCRRKPLTPQDVRRIEMKVVPRATDTGGLCTGNRSQTAVTARAGWSAYGSARYPIQYSGRSKRTSASTAVKAGDWAAGARTGSSEPAGSGLLSSPLNGAVMGI